MKSKLTPWTARTFMDALDTNTLDSPKSLPCFLLIYFPILFIPIFSRIYNYSLTTATIITDTRWKGLTNN